VNEIADAALAGANAAAAALSSDVAPGDSTTTTGTRETAPAGLPSGDGNAPDLDSLTTQYGPDLINRILKNPELAKQLYQEVRKDPEKAGPWGDDIRKARADAAAKERQRVIAEQEESRAKWEQEQRLRSMDPEDFKNWYFSNQDAQAWREQERTQGEIEAHRKWIARVTRGIPDEVQKDIWEKFSPLGEDAWEDAIREYRETGKVHQTRQSLEQEFQGKLKKALDDQRQELEAKLGTGRRQASQPVSVIPTGDPLGFGSVGDEQFMQDFNDGILDSPADFERAVKLMHAIERG
jgi:hypothetical protein